MRMNSPRVKSSAPSRRVRRLLSAAFALVLAASFLASGFAGLFRAQAAGLARSVIVEFKAEPGAVWKARLEKSGQKVSDDQLRQYRASITAQQNQFLEELKSRGVAFKVEGVDLKDFAVAVAGRAD